MKKINVVHYSREGYEGNYSYKTVCGKTIHSHSDIDGHTIYPAQTTCKECIESKAYKTDLDDSSKTDVGIIRRIFIQSDFLSASEFRSVQNDVHHIIKQKGLKHVDRIFSQVIDKAWHDLDKTWKAVKGADEIYGNTSLVPLCGDASMGAPVIFNGMCKRAVEEGITGKSVYILTQLSYINWYFIDIEQMKKAFAKNDLYMYDEQYNLTKVDVTPIKRK